MIVSNDTKKKKIFGKMEHSFRIKTFKLGIAENFPNQMKGIYEKPIPNIIINGEIVLQTLIPL